MGEQKRDFVYIQDVIAANVKAIHAKKVESIMLVVARQEAIMTYSMSQNEFG